VCKSDDTIVAGDEPRCDQPVDHRIVVRTGDDESPRQPAADRLAIGAWRDQSQQEVTQYRSLLLLCLVVDLLGGLRDRATDAARGVVAGDGQGTALAALPGFGQRVRHQRQGARLVGHLVDHEVGEAWLHRQGGHPGRLLDR
jgi:hypothetical protein